MPMDDPRATLLVIDVQHAIDDPSWKVHGPRNNPSHHHSRNNHPTRRLVRAENSQSVK